MKRTIGAEAGDNVKCKMGNVKGENGQSLRPFAPDTGGGMMRKGPRTTRPFTFYLLLFTFYLSFFLPGCYEPVEGCLDPNAFNYAVDADQACSNCCEYPQLRLDFQHKVVKDGRTENLIFLDSVYYDGAGNPFRVGSLQFYLSELHLFRTNDTEQGVEERLKLPVFNDLLQVEEAEVESNFVLANPASFGTKEIGTFRAAGTYRKVSFRLGLSGTVNRVAFDLLPEELAESPLADANMYRNFDQGYIFNRLQLYRDTTAAAQPVLLTAGAELINQTVELPIDFKALEGFNIKITLLVDYQQWFRNINVKTDSDTQLMQKIVANMPGSFSVVAIDF